LPTAKKVKEKETDEVVKDEAYFEKLEAEKAKEDK
jgi:hypothetical protein